MKFTSIKSGLGTWGALFILMLGTSSCNQKQADPLSAESVQKLTVSISEEKDWSERMALSIIKRSPEAWMNDFAETPQWNYTHGLILHSMIKTWEQTGEDLYFGYAKAYADTMIMEDGSIRDYDITSFNIDHIAPGWFLLKVYEETKEERILKAIKTLKDQLEWQPRTKDGGYWHKLRYPWQMWLDGLFMGEPFNARYAVMFNKPEIFDDIATQFKLAEKHTRDEETGLLYHGYDESRLQRWSDPETGLSSEFWARAMGWYVMGIVEVLDEFPKDHPGRQDLIDILNRSLDAALRVRDPEKHVWWQVLDQHHREGNYLESTSSCMFTYAMIKGVNRGYLPETYRAEAQKSYNAILDEFIRVDESGEVHLTNCCAVAGLGGNPYRDGTYDYYIGEPIREDDPKGLGPFVMASLEFEKGANN